MFSRQGQPSFVDQAQCASWLIMHYWEEKEKKKSPKAKKVYSTVVSFVVSKQLAPM